MSVPNYTPAFLVLVIAIMMCALSMTINSVWRKFLDRKRVLGLLSIREHHDSVDRADHVHTTVCTHAVLVTMLSCLTTILADEIWPAFVLATFIYVTSSSPGFVVARGDR